MADGGLTNMRDQPVRLIEATLAQADPQVLSDIEFARSKDPAYQAARAQAAAILANEQSLAGMAQKFLGGSPTSPEQSRAFFQTMRQVNPQSLAGYY